MSTPRTVILKLYALSVFSGLLLGLAWLPPFPGYMVFVGLIPLLFAEKLLVKQQHHFRPFNALLAGWAGFFTWNLLALWWLGKVNAGAMLLMVALNSFLYALLFWLFHLAHRRLAGNFARAFFFFLWLGFEYFHAHWEAANPWLQLGHALGKHIRMVQWYDATGPLGGTAWALMLNIAGFGLLDYWLQMRTAKGSIGQLLVWLTVLLVPLVMSHKRYAHYDGKNYKTIQAAVVQPGTDPYQEKFDTTQRKAQLARFTALASKIPPSAQLIVGPETMLPNGIWANGFMQSGEARMLRRFMQDYPQSLFVGGAYLYQRVPALAEKPLYARPLGSSGDWFIYRNAAFALRQGTLLPFYFKQKLLPGTETLPFPMLTSWMAHFTSAPGGPDGMLTPGNTIPTYRLPNDTVDVAPLVCWESVFTYYPRRALAQGAEILAVLTNDGWWGNTPGYRQHLTYSQVQAISHRRSVVRAANTGISACIAPTGKLLASAAFEAQTNIHAPVPVNQEITYFTRMGDYIGRMALFFSALLLLYTLTQYLLPRKK